jgi:hypothetical protein
LLLEFQSFKNDSQDWCASAHVPPEIWNRLGTKILPKLRAGSELKIGLEFSVTVSANSANGLITDLRQILQELGLAEAVRVDAA